MNNLHRPDKHLKKKVFHEYHDSQRESMIVDLKDKTLLRRYVAYLRAQDVHTQRVHAFSIAGLITCVVAILWLHFVYGLWNLNTEVYDPSMTYEEKVLTEDASSTPSSSYSSLFKSTLDRLKSINFNMKDAASHTQTFDRASSTGDN